MQRWGWGGQRAESNGGRKEKAGERQEERGPWELESEERFRPQGGEQVRTREGVLKLGSPVEWPGKLQNSPCLGPAHGDSGVTGVGYRILRCLQVVLQDREIDNN